jgi:hypothetical protein
MSYHHRRKHGLRLKKHLRVLAFIAFVVLILYVYAVEVVVGDSGWAWIWRSSHRRGWVDVSPPSPPGHRR